MESNRPFTGWLKRWFSAEWQPDISDRLQGVVVVDDVRELIVPAHINRWGADLQTIGPVAGQYSLSTLSGR